jgi:hypothetical protein
MENTLVILKRGDIEILGMLICNHFGLLLNSENKKTFIKECTTSCNDYFKTVPALLVYQAHICNFPNIAITT